MAPWLPQEMRDGKVVIVNVVKQVAIKAAKQAGALLRERVGNIKSIDYKSAFNLVTDVDKESERLIISIIREEFENHQILGEESGAHDGSPQRWLIDPIDGTTNFAHGYPFFCVSIGFEDAGERKLGVVYDPIADELFFAEKGHGAFLNDKKIQVSSHTRLAVCLCATGFPADTSTAKISNMAQFATVTDATQGVRRDGSAALDLSYVACGRLDAYWELKLAPWDLAAGTLLVTEAGGKISNLTGDEFDLNTGHVIASNALIHDELVDLLSFGQTFADLGGIGTDKDVARK